MKIKTDRGEILFFPECDTDTFLLGKLFNRVDMVLDFSSSQTEVNHKLESAVIKKENLINLLNEI